MGVIGYELDIDRLLWIPGQKTIFLPPIEPRYLLSDIIIEWEKNLPRLTSLFESQYLYNRIKNQVNDIQAKI